MKLFTIALVVMLLLIVTLGFLVVRAYNRLVSYRKRFKNAFAQINVQLTHRYDLIPNLVETAKAYMKHERETLEAVIAARNQAVTAVKQASNSPDDPGTIQRGLTEVPLLHLHRHHPFAFRVCGLGQKLAWTAGIAVTVFQVLPR